MVYKDSAGALGSLSNNTASSWWRDPGLVKLHLIILSFFACTITSGYDNSLLNNLQSLSTFLTSVGHPSASALGVIGAVGTVGGVIGCYPASWIADRYGRRTAMAAGSLVSIIGIFVQGFAKSAVMYGAGRLLVGIGNLPVVVTGAALVNEIAHPRYRGRIACFYNVIWYVGAILASWLCYGFRVHVSSSWQWRVPTLIQAVFALWTFCLRFWAPESPRWLISQGREAEAAAIFYKYHANGDTSDEMVTAEIKEIKEVLDAETAIQGEMSWVKAFKTKGNRRRMLVVGLFATSVAWTSQSIVTYYNSAILKQAGITATLTQLEFNGGLSLLDLVAAFGGAVLSAFIGRRTQILIGFCGMLAAHIVVTVLASQYAKDKVAGVGFAMVGFIWVESAMYNVGLNPVTYAYPAEVMSFALRAKGLAWFLFISDLNGIVTRYVNPVGLANITYWFFVVYCFFYVFSIAGVWFLYPETKNKTLEEIEAEIDGMELVINGRDDAVEVVRLEGVNTAHGVVDEDQKY